MGFRGEALPSIAAVSKLTLTTRAREAADGDGAYELTVEGGIAGEGRHVGAPVGTRVEVRDLLVNVPARLKFMRGEATETAHVAEAVLRLALAFPDGALSPALRRAADARSAAARVGPRARARGARPRARAGASCTRRAARRAASRVEAYLGSPAESANTSRGTYLFVNRASCAIAASCTRWCSATARRSSAGAIRWRSST